MPKKTSLGSIAFQIEKFAARMDKCFSAISGDVADIKHDMATKEQVITLHTQVNSIEGQLRGMNYIKLESRLADLEEKIFGRTRA